jgi:hypothetical protein
MQAMKGYRLAVAMLLAASHLSAAPYAPIHKCVAPDGTRIFQQTPCLPAPQAAKPAANPVDQPATAADGIDEIVQMVLLTKLGCDAVVTGFEVRTAETFAAWRRVRHEAIARVEARPEYRTRLAEKQALLSRQSTRRDDPEMSQYCNGQFLRVLSREASP